MKIFLYYHTLKYLKLSQILWRIYVRFFNINAKTISAHSLKRRKVKGVWRKSIKKMPCLLSATQAVFLNQCKDIRAKTIWNDASCDTLWLYNLHYFDDLVADSAHARSAWQHALMHRWVNENPVSMGIGWQPYPLSLRIVNWIKYFLSGHKANSAMLQSLSLQVRVLVKKIEWHLLGNHVLANAKALVFAGLFFEGAEANKWFHQGLKIFEQQFPEQLLTDGAHFELSSMYQGIIIEDLLDLIQLLMLYQVKIPITWRSYASNALLWLNHMCHPDGDIAFFNDATLGISPNVKDLKKYASTLAIKDCSIPLGLNHLTDSGYCRLSNKDAVIICDVGKIGPDYLPGHAHADTLSFEMSLKGQRIFVNSGISTYANSPLRLKQRGSATHNTLMINNQNSSEVWSAFRVARRAKVFAIGTDSFDAGLFLQASHDGYKRLAGKPIHTRAWMLSNKALQIKDTVSGHGKHNISIHFHLHPHVQLLINDDKQGILVDKENKTVATLICSVPFQCASTFYYSGFNQATQNQLIIMSIVDDLPTTVITELKWI
jgi:uncharacterized heparinase superfamily protein